MLWGWSADKSLSWWRTDPLATKPCCSLCLRLLGDHIMIAPTNLRVHKGLDDVLTIPEPRGQLEINRFHRFFSPRKRDQSTRQENSSDDNHVFIISSLHGVHLFWTQKPWPYFKHTLKGCHIHFNKGKAHSQIKVTSLKANNGKWTLKKVSSSIQ